MGENIFGDKERNLALTRLMGRYSLAKSLVADAKEYAECIALIDKISKAFDTFQSDLGPRLEKIKFLKQNVEADISDTVRIRNVLKEQRDRLDLELQHNNDGIRGMAKYRMMEKLYEQHDSIGTGDMLANWYLYELALIFTEKEKIQWQMIKDLFLARRDFYPFEKPDKAEDIDMESIRRRVNTFKTFREKHQLAETFEMKQFSIGVAALDRKIT